MNNEKPIIWDPVGEQITSTSFYSEQQAIIKKVNFYKNHFYIIPLILFLCFLIIPFAISSFFIDHYFDIRGLFASCIPIFLFNEYLLHLQDEVILYLLCEKNHWAYKPKGNDERIRKFLADYKDIFNQGHDQSIEDQIWGSLDQPDNLNFWRGTFSYKTGYGRSTETHTKAVFILKLNNSLMENFSLVHAGFLSKFEEDIKTESEEFNNIFRIIHPDKTAIAKTQIIKILSPSVQIRLITFAKQYHVEKIFFKSDTMTAVFKDEIWKPKFTNFIKKVAIDQRDEEVFYSALIDMMKIPAEMIQFIQ